MAAKGPARASLRYAKAPLSPRYQWELHQLLGHCCFWFTPLRIPFFWARGFQFSADVGTEAAIRPPLEAKFFQMRYIVEPAHDQLVAFDNNPARSSRG